MYFFQRLTGVAALIFIFFHTYEVRLAHLFSPQPITFADMHAIFHPTWAKWFYAIGILCAAFHLTNGVGTALMTWGITVSQRSQKIVAAVMWVAFLGFAGWGLLILRAFS